MNPPTTAEKLVLMVTAEVKKRPGLALMCGTVESTASRFSSNAKVQDHYVHLKLAKLTWDNQRVFISMDVWEEMQMVGLLGDSHLHSYAKELVEKLDAALNLEIEKRNAQ